MTTTDHREMAAIYEEQDGFSATEHLLAAIHDELRAIRDQVAPTPKEPALDEDECCDCHLAAVIERDKAVKERDKARRAAEALAEECDGLRSERAVDLDTIERLREERDKARTQIISLTGERDDLRATVARVESLATCYEADARREGYGGETWSTTATAIRAMLDGAK